MPIRISLLEALTIADVMTPEQLGDMARHARKVLQNARSSRSLDEYVTNHRRDVGFCPLLNRESGSCTQYANRPTRCRDTYSALPARFCAPDGLRDLTRAELKQYRREVRASPVTDGETHYVAPLEDLSVPAWEQFSRLMRREFGLEVWGDFAVLVTATRQPGVMEAVATGRAERVVRALKQAGLFHPEIVEVE